ncbi:MAG TPA: Fic family protein [Solirubrobacterales bacterium]|nr:Fic family protein [Solirubrobacterales bacterium]
MADVKQRFLDEPEVFRPADAAAASRAQRRGELRRLARGLYTWNLDEPPQRLLRRRWMDVAALYFPGAVLVDRSAVEARPADDGSVFLDSGPERGHPNAVSLPGLVLRPRAGPGPIAGDMQFGLLHRSGDARTALDNVRPSRARTGVARTLTTAELEEWLERIARNRGEDDLLRIRDEARELAPALGAEPEQRRLDELISALLGTGDSRLVTESARARGRRRPFDAARVGLFETLHGALAGHVATLRPEPADPERVFAFFEAYFSNFIEGTEFEVEEAEEIVFKGVIPEDRPEDAHDVLGTFRVVADPNLRTRTPADADDFAELLRLLNRNILEGRPDMAPGEWKQRPNRAGGTSFVAPDLVLGTLREAWRFYETLPPGFPRALFAMFAVSEVHPFADGNGRVSRALLNAELSSAAQCRIAVPLCFRADYLGALRAMSRQSNPEPLLRMADRAQHWSSRVDWSSMSLAVPQLEGSNALVPPDEAEERGLILLDPD